MILKTIILALFAKAGSFLSNIFSTAGAAFWVFREECIEKGEDFDKEVLRGIIICSAIMFLVYILSRS